MAPTLVVEIPDRPDRVVELADMAVMLGRSPECDVQIPEDSVSARHLRLSPVGDGAWICLDLDSTSGTRIGKRRVRRALLAYGDVLQLGRARVRFLEAPPRPEASAPAEPLVGGSLALRVVSRPAEPAATAAPAQAPKAAPPPAAPPPPRSDPAPARRPVRPIDGRAMGRAVLLVVLAVGMVAGVELLLGPAAERAREQAKERRHLRQALETMDIASDTFAAEVEDFLAAHPRAEERDALLAYLAAVRAGESRRIEAENELRALTVGLHDLSESEVRGRLLELQRTLPLDEDIAERARLYLAELDRRHEGQETEALAAVVRAAEDRVRDGDPAGALRRLTAFRNAWPSLGPEALTRLRTLEDDAIRAAEGLAGRALAAAEEAATSLERRRILGEAWRGLAGTPQGERVADALRFTRSPLDGTTPGATPAAAPPDESGATPDLLARAAAAEDLVRARRWGDALVALKALIDGARPGLLRDEWLARSDEVRQILTLVEGLDGAAHGERPPTPRLSMGKVTVEGATPSEVRLDVAGEKRAIPWGDLGDADLLAVLTPARPTVEERMGVAVLAAGIGRRDEVVRVLLPLFEKGEPAPQAQRLIARHLFGRAEPPAGGYRVHDGEILDKEGYERRLREARCAELSQRAQELLAKVAEDPAFKKLERLATLREELDRRRSYALLAIFNEKHYPYPYDRGSEQYQSVQKEIDRRVDAVREIWDDDTKVRIARKGPLARLLDDWDEVIAELKRLEQDVGDLEKKMAARAAYVTDEPLTIRDYFLDETERQLFAYNRWVMDTWNPQQVTVATEAERNQTRVTNEYRTMIGYAVVVTPGPALYEALSHETVVKILDEATLAARPVALRAVRIDDRLVRSARAHSLDMQRRGFFSHFAPANPATGEPRTTPFDRMKKAGYEGGGGSENIANGASSPEQAHMMWVHSSGHHRNILSPWHDQGVGQAGRLWTQNYGVGGGAPARIPDEPRDPPGDATDDAGAPRRPRR